MAYESTFPASLQPIASLLLPALANGERRPAFRGFIVSLQSERLSIPSRVYYDPAHLRHLIKNSHGDARAFVLCMGTRHWNGYVREDCLRELISVDLPWVVPFVVQLVGEYVIEIVQVITAALGEMNKAAYGEFARKNPQFMATTQRRVISYWDAYHRARFPELASYPGSLVLRAIEGMRDGTL